MLPPPCITVEMVPGFFQTWHLAYRPNSSILVSSDQCILFPMVWESFKCLLANSKRAVMCILLRSHFRLATLPSRPDGGVLQRRLSFMFSHLHRGTSTDNSFDLMAWFLPWHALSTVGPYIDRWVPFQITSNQLNLPLVDSNQVVETSLGWSMETGMHQSSISSLIAKGLTTYVNKVFLFFKLNKITNISINLFSLCHYGLWFVNCMWTQRHNKTVILYIFFIDIKNVNGPIGIGSLQHHKKASQPTHGKPSNHSKVSNVHI